MHVADFECKCGRKFYVGGKPGIYTCRTCNVDINFGEYVESQVDDKVVERVERANRFRDMNAKRDRIKAAILKRRLPNEKLGELAYRLMHLAPEGKLRKYLSDWLSECGCTKDAAIENLNEQEFKP